MKRGDLLTCRCGTDIPTSCGFHPEGDDCMCFGTICGRCLDAILTPQAIPLTRYGENESSKS